MKNLNRRTFLQYGIGGAATLMFSHPRRALGQPAGEPHFFLNLLLNGGADTSYMFDARSLAMTAAGKTPNYLREEPKPWTGANGTACLATHLVAPLNKFKDSFSIINGVVMAPAFNGHVQNMNFLFAGNTFGGESFVPHLNAGTGRAASLSAIANQSVLAELSNHGQITQVSAAMTGALMDQLRGNSIPDTREKLMAFIRSRYSAVGAGPGHVNKGAAQMLAGFDAFPDLRNKLGRLPRQSGTTDKHDDQQFANLVCAYFRNNIARSAVWVFPEKFDVHAAALAVKQPALFANVIRRIALIFETLSKTPYDQNRSMLDVTTVMVSSEFSRTLRGEGESLEHMGSNHNQMANTIILGGKGIRGGLVVGSTDMPSAGAPVSAAHKTLDPKLELLFGNPFDFALMQSRKDLPAAFVASDYLTMGSVVNTVYSIFGVERARFRTLEAGGLPAPILTALLR